VSYTVEDVDRVVKEGWVDEDGLLRTGWESLLYAGKYNRTVDLPGIGTATTIHDGTENDETAANGYYFVFTITDPDGVRTFKRDGWYASHYGGELDGPTFEVKAVQRVVTFWEESE
jgi:hypothetical protein